MSVAYKSASMGTHLQKGVLNMLVSHLISFCDRASLNLQSLAHPHSNLLGAGMPEHSGLSTLLCVLWTSMS